MLSVVVTTYMPSPYQTGLFDSLAASKVIALRVLYEHANSPERKWAQQSLHHDFRFISERVSGMDETDIRSADICVFSGYRDPRALKLIKLRAATGKPFALWGERLGFIVPQFLGRLYRRALLHAIHTSNAEIWGIGKLALESFRYEFGTSRTYRNLPYVSDLSAFAAIESRPHCDRPLRVLFSGSLMRRKGIDLLANALEEVWYKGISLDAWFVGDGEERGLIEALAGRHKGRVTLFGFRQMDMLPSIYAQADVLVAPSRHDGWGLIIPEGMASGLPILSSDATGAAVELVDESTGWIIPAGRLRPLAERLQMIADIPRERLRRMGHAGRRRSEGYTLAAGRDRMLVAIDASFAASH